MDQNAITDAGIREPVGLIHPIPDSPGMALGLGGKRFEVNEVGKKAV
jgi:hypothetical protein